MNKISALIEDIQLYPFEGIGKPEQLKYQLSGKWSRRINQEHRIIYKVTEENTIEILDILINKRSLRINKETNVINKKFTRLHWR